MRATRIPNLRLGVGAYVKIGLNAIFWGLWVLSVGQHLNNVPQRYWYHDVPLAMLMISVVGPMLARGSEVIINERRRNIVRAATTLGLVLFLPYACMSGGGV